MYLSIGLTGQSENWFVSESDAIDYAQEHNTSILMVFAGSDWCRPCIKFKKQVLMDSDFVTFAQEDLAILYLDFPANKSNKLSKELKTQNENLAERFNKSGAFPKIILFDSDMNKLKDLTFKNQSAEEFIKQLAL